MKFLIDECVDYLLVGWMRDLGYDVLSIAEDVSGIKDSNVLALAVSQVRVLVTNDKGFSDMVFREKRDHTGIILLRMQDETLGVIKQMLSELFKHYHTQIENNFIVINKNSIRGVKKIDA